jgi:hypothetical protein
MRRELRHEVEIDAPAATVWNKLTATADYSWNPFITRIEGRLRAGEQLCVEIKPPDARPMKFRPTVLEVREAAKLRWLGRFLVRGLLDGDHSFELEPLGATRTRFIQVERFSGILVGVFRTTLDKTQEGFAEMNFALKRTAEERGL